MSEQKSIEIVSESSAIADTIELGKLTYTLYHILSQFHFTLLCKKVAASAEDAEVIVEAATELSDMPLEKVKEVEAAADEVEIIVEAATEPSDMPLEEVKEVEVATEEVLPGLGLSEACGELGYTVGRLKGVFTLGIDNSIEHVSLCIHTFILLR